jgi:hypothetical protein
MGILSGRDLRQPPLAVLIVMCWLIAVAQLLYVDWGSVTRTLGDTDDAMRLVAVRNFLAGQGWFDLHEARLSPPLGYDSHWSRLIDAGLAGLFLAFNLVVDAARAELMMRVVWPLLWLLPLITATVAIAWRIGGREAALVVLLLTVVGMPAFQQFRPGRIDHHNIQITLAVASLAAAAWGEKVGAAAACGALTGLALAIGLEGLAFVVVAGAAMAMRYCVDRDAAPSLRAYGLALAVSTLSAFLVSIGPDRWGRTACDAMAVNWMEPVVAAGVLLAWAGGVLPGRRAATRWLAVVGIAAVSAAIFIALEPRCLRGPFAMVDPALSAVWMSHIREVQPLLVVLQRDPTVAAAVLVFPVVALIAAAVLAREPEMRRNGGYLVAAAGTLAGFALMFAAVKGFNYAIWIGMPLVAAAALRLFASLKLTSVTARLFTAIMLTPAALSSGAIAAVEAVGPKLEPKSERSERGCFDTRSYAALARLPRGLIAGDVDYGPFILALTPHATLAAPYHRLADGIRTAHQVFTRPPAQANRIVQEHRVDYLVTCGAYAMEDVPDAERAASLAAQLGRGEAPDWLEKLPSEDGQAFTIYRVRRHES